MIFAGRDHVVKGKAHGYLTLVQDGRQGAGVPENKRYMFRWLPDTYRQPSPF
jgi:hypothetical protein